MELPITWDILWKFVNETKQQREKEFQNFVLGSLIPVKDVVKTLQEEIVTSVNRNDGTTCFRIVAGNFPQIYRRFGDIKRLQKEIWVVLGEYLANFPTTNCLLETSGLDHKNTPVSCQLILCFNIHWTPPTSNQTNSHPQPE